MYVKDAHGVGSTFRSRPVGRIQEIPQICHRCGVSVISVRVQKRGVCQYSQFPIYSTYDGEQFRSHMAQTHELTVDFAFCLMGLSVPLDQNTVWHLTSDSASAPVSDSVLQMESHGVR